VLLFQTLSVDHDKNVIRINGTDVPNRIPVSRSNNDWNGNVIIIPPNVLRTGANTLRIEARDSSGGTGDEDEFVVDNVVVLYKTT
jgi:hypothetical protein